MINRNDISANLVVFSAYLLAFLMSFGLHIANLAAAFFVFVSVVDFFINQRTIKLSKSQRIIFITVIILYLLNFLSLFYTKDIQSTREIIFLKIYLLLIPVAVVLNSENLAKHRQQVLNFFISGNFIASTVLIIRAFVKSTHLENGHLVFQAALKKNTPFFFSIVDGGNHFFYTDFSYFYHPSYIGMFTVFIVAILLFINKYKADSKLGSFIIKNKKFLILFFTLIVFMFNSKANLLALSIVYLYFFSVSKLKNKLVYLSVFSVLFLGFIFINPRTEAMLKYIKNPPQEYHKNRGLDRLFIWKASAELIKDKPILGVGAGNVQDYLQKEFETNVRELEGDKYNCHNEFLQTTLSYGMIGLLVLLLLFTFILIFSIKQKNRLLMSLWLIVFTNFLFESMLNRVAGVIFFSFFVSLLIFADDKKTPDLSNEKILK